MQSTKSLQSQYTTFHYNDKSAEFRDPVCLILSSSDGHNAGAGAWPPGLLAETLLERLSHIGHASVLSPTICCPPRTTGMGVVIKRESIKDGKCFAHREVHRYVGETYITLKWHVVWFGVGGKTF